mgnify:CR=1 FL=1
MTVTIESETEVPFDFEYEQTAREVIAQAMDSEEFPYEAEVNLLLVDNDIIHELNLEHRGIDRATDVLSFPMIEYAEPADFDGVEHQFDDCVNPDTEEVLLGDIVICVESVYEQAEEYGHSVKREYAFLITHSMLHLMGYDHMVPEEAEVMEEHQRRILDVLKIKR